MDSRTQRALAVVFSILIVTATLTPASAALEPSGQSATDDAIAALTDSLGDFDALPAILGKGNGNGDDNGNGSENGGGNGGGSGDGNGNGGKTSRTNGTTTASGTTATPPRTTAPLPETQTSTPPKGPPTTTRDDEAPGPPGNETRGPPENETRGPPENKTHGPPEDRGPPEERGPPEDRGPPEERGGPPEWAQNPETPPSVAHNRSAIRNRSEALANATVNVTVRDDASAADYRLAAIAALQQAEFDGPGRSAERHRITALKALNESLEYVLDANHTTSATLFEHDKEASTPPQFAPNVTKLLVRSDERLAETAIADAERVRKTLRERNVSFDESAVEANVSAAKAAVERADHFRGRGQPQTAISQYRVAWIHAQQALDVLDLATTPNVTITTRGDLPHEGNVTYELRGRVFDVRGHELTALVSLNGANRTLALDVNATPETTPGAVATFRTNLTLTRQINTIEVRATDSNRHWAPDYDDANATTGRDRLLLDGDGLPDTYEQNTVGTDPLDPDSNSTRTVQNESENNVTDGAEDLDGDGETVYEAYRFGLNPLDNDTDGDSLRDGFELRFQGIDPAANDTDNDSVADPTEDLDNDTLSNYREQNAGTNPVRVDTDIDGLNDSAEVTNGTDPLAPDTDDDGLLDPDEYEVGTDPTVADTDGDGVLDGNETFSTETKNESVGAAVNISGEGNVADTVTIQNETNDQIQTETVSNASASEVLHIDADAEFEQANLSIDYDEKQVENESALAVYTYDPKLQTYRKLPSEVDVENDSVTGTTPHFSTFVVLNKSEWQAYMESRAKPKPRFALNESFSDLGGWNCNGDCSVGEGRVVVGQNSSEFFSDEADAECGGPHIPDNGECIGGGGGSGDNDSDDDNDDGSEPSPPPSLGSANLSRSILLSSDTVEVTASGPVSGFAEESNASVTIAVRVGGETRRVLELDGKDGERKSESGYINETFENPAGETMEVWIQKENLAGASLPYLDIETKRDSDGDGLTNGLEELGVKTGTSRIYTDPYDADTDRDGLSDSQEILGYVPSYVDANSGHYQMVSDPTKFDTDTDGLSDYEETEIWDTEPRNPDTDDDGANDLVDKQPATENIAPNVKITSEIEYPENTSAAPPRNRDDYNKFIFVRVSDEVPIADLEVNGYYEPVYGDSSWKTSEAYQREYTFQGMKDGYHVNTFSIPIHQHGVLDEIPEYYYVNATDANGNRVAIRVDPNQSDVLPNVESAGAVPFLGGVAATAGAEAIGGSAAVGSGISVMTVATTGGAVLAVGAAAAYGYDQRAAPTYESDQIAGKQSLTVPATEYVETYPPEETPFDEPVKLPSGTVYEPDAPVDDGHERGFGWEYIKRTPGLNDYDDIEEVLDTPNPVSQYGKYDVVIGDNPNSPGQIQLWLLDGVLVSAFSFEPLDSPGVTKDVILDDEYYKNHIEPQDDHLNDDEIEKVVENPDEVYSNGEVYVWVKVINGVYHYVRGEDFDGQAVPLDNIQIRSAYTNTQSKLTNLIQRHGLKRIWSK